ncbi:hypothetical protein DSL72_004791 [Monilinia vaccinii-corymbosi]|uniref:C2H2-type domain-containing protein n=1 Tax=Monilinia vaccinii-corymbosi TaxID=61207 RepID=A0A8A3P932_9HELO|nr:hypothetical protein DSL72_004791 [Monilinia vaccinii-corymbosi]
MASEQETISATVPVLAAKLSNPATKSASAPSNHTESDPTSAKSFKRSRPDQTQPPANPTSIANAGLVISPAQAPRFGATSSPIFPAVPLTGAAAYEDERRKSEEAQISQSGAMSKNPGHEAITSLLSGGVNVSRPQDAPATTAMMSEGMSAAASALTIPTTMPFDERPETSPASVTSLASLGSTAQTATASPTVVASPGAITNASEAENRDTRSGISQLQAAMDEQASNKSMSFPGNLAQVDASQYPTRGMSLPMPNHNVQLAPRSPSQKKHKCPYCETEFTRHHNLKSHLLTHSQEKPYVCQTCQMRFRRLHDLKRHMKLHTGERPHICPKCDRKFARGDALARHSKGLGGCAGRRASMGSFGGDDEFDGPNVGEVDENVMDGIMYTNGNPHPNEVEMSEEDGRRFSLPSIKAQHVAGSSGNQGNYPSHSRASSTYPPAGPRPNPPTGLYPPGTDRVGSSSSATSPSMQNNVISVHTPNNSLSSMPLSTSGSMFSQSGMTESPKPLSPAAMLTHQLGHDSASITRQRSPSLTTQFQQQHFGRHQSGRSPPPGMPLPSPHSTQGPKLPALAGLAPPDTRFTLTSQLTNQQSPGNSQQASQQQQSLQQSTSPTTLFQPSNPLQSRGPPSHQGSGDSSNNLFASGASGVWAYVNTLEEKLKLFSEKVLAMEAKEKSQEEKIKAQDEKVNQLSEELVSLRRQLSSQTQIQPSGTT